MGIEFITPNPPKTNKAWPEVKKNPGAMISGIKWKGLAGTYSNKYSGFCIFSDPKWGVRAFLKTMSNRKAEGIVSFLKFFETVSPPKVHGNPAQNARASQMVKLLGKEFASQFTDDEIILFLQTNAAHEAGYPWLTETSARQGLEEFAKDWPDHYKILTGRSAVSTSVKGKQELFDFLDFLESKNSESENQILILQKNNESVKQNLTTVKRVIRDL